MRSLNLNVQGAPIGITNRNAEGFLNISTLSMNCGWLSKLIKTYQKRTGSVTLFVQDGITSDDLRAWYTKYAADWPGGVSVSEDRFVEMHLENPARFQEIYLKARDNFLQE